MHRLQYYLVMPQRGASKTPPLYAGDNPSRVKEIILRHFNKEAQRTNRPGRNILVLDGPAGAGKTLLAQALALQLEAPLVPVDAFFLPLDLRSEERLREVGGNIHYERFAEEVLRPATCGREAFQYRVFDCRRGVYGSAIEVPAHRCLVVEGVYSLHPYFGNYWTASLLLGIDPGLQRERILARESPESAAKYFRQWLPLEQSYFAAPDLKDRADLLLTATREPRMR